MAEPKDLSVEAHDESVEVGVEAPDDDDDDEPAQTEITTEAIPTKSETGAARIQRRYNVTAEAAPFDKSFHPGGVCLFYSQPRQRQRWGDTQILPRVNWGDLFFDLFYVGATYNVSDIVVEKPDMTGILYAAGTFLPIMGIWSQKMVYDARYVTESDVYHRFMNMLRLLILGVAVVHIQPVQQLSNDTQYPAMFAFSLMLVLERILSMILYVEIYFKGVGQPAMKVASMREVRDLSVYLAFYLTATIVAAVRFFTNQHPSDTSQSERLFAETSPTNPDTTDSQIDHVPISLCLAGFLISLAMFAINVIFCFPTGGRHKEISVPLNVDFVIHRRGEWIMLMLGESIFSILIVDLGIGEEQEGERFYSVFYCGVLTVIGLQFLHFQSQPHHADLHAMRRSVNAGLCYHLLEHAYSLALVLLGASFTFFLTFSEGYSDKTHRRTSTTPGGGTADSSDIVQAAAYIFGGSLAVIFLSLDLQMLTHLGMAECVYRCSENGRKLRNWKGILVLLLRLIVIGIVAALGRFATDPKKLSIIGLCCVIVQMVFRRLGISFLSAPHDDEHRPESDPAVDVGVEENAAAVSGDGDSETGDQAQWPNVTSARAEAASSDDDGGNGGNIDEEEAKEGEN